MAGRNGASVSFRAIAEQRMEQGDNDGDADHEEDSNITWRAMHADQP